MQDEAVYEGDGHQPIRKAMEQGRLLDLFMIVANLLRTYNSGSPFVSLSDWHGVELRRLRQHGLRRRKVDVRKVRDDGVR